VGVLWQFFISHWLGIFWSIIGAPLIIIGVMKVYDEVRFQIERRRYQRANK